MSINLDRLRHDPGNEKPYYEREIKALRLIFSNASPDIGTISRIVKSGLLGENTIVIQNDKTSFDFFGNQTVYQHAVEKLDAIFGAVNVARSDHWVSLRPGNDAVVTYIHLEKPAAPQQ